jgi:hypothetical protein
VPTPRRAALVLGVALLAPLAAAAPASAVAVPDPFGPCAPTWQLTSTDTFQGADALARSQGATTDGTYWYFSWQGGIQRTLDVNGTYVPEAAGTWAPQQAVAPSGDPTGENHVGNNHIGDIDYFDGTLYAPFEDGGQSNLNNPEYQTPYIETYDPTTLRNTGAFKLDPAYHLAGVPWVAIDSARHELITAEWDMPHDRLNIYNLPMHDGAPDRLLNLHYPAELGAGFHLSRIQGAKVYGDTMYATRDDSDKSVWAIDLNTGDVKELFALKPGVPAELEGLALRPMADGSLLHVLIVLDNQEDPTDPNSAKIHVEFQHFAPVADATCPGPSLPETPVVPALIAIAVVAVGAVALRRRVRDSATVS